VLAVVPCAAQCGPFTPKDTKTFSDLYDNLQGLECAYAMDPRPAPVRIGTLHASYQHGPLEAIFSPDGQRQSDGTWMVTVFGTDAIIAIAQDRSQGDVVSFDFQTEITEIRNINGVVFSKQNAWDNWPMLRFDQSGNVLSTLYDVGDATQVSGVVHVSTVSQPGRPSQRGMDGRFIIRIARGHLGVFTIPIMPVSILYPPPPGDDGLNTVTSYAQQSSTTQVQTTISTSNSTTVPVDYDPGASTLASAVSALKTGCKAIPVYGTVISSCLGFIADNMGSTSITSESGKLSAGTNGSAMTRAQSTETFIGGTYPQGPFQGKAAVPGLDDMVNVLVGVRLAWVPDGTSGVKLIPMGPALTETSIPMRALLNDLPILEASQPPEPEPQPASTPPVSAGDGEFSQTNTGSGSGKTVAWKARPISASAMAALGRLPGLNTPPQGLMTGLDLVTVRSLLALDPLVPVSGAAPVETTLEQNPRYRPTPVTTAEGQAAMEELTINSWDQPRDLELDLQYVDSKGQNTVQFTTVVEDDKPGLLGKFLGMGPQTRQTLKTTSSVGCTGQTSASTMRKVKLHVTPPHEGAFVLRVYEDLVFGTYVFSQVGNPYLQAQGTATDESGTPQGNQWVTLNVGGRTFGARTDSQGRYAIYSSNPNAGSGKLSVGRRASIISVKPVRGIAQPTAPQTLPRPILRPTAPIAPAPQAPQAPPVQPPATQAAPAGHLLKPIVLPGQMKPAAQLAAPQADCASFDPAGLKVAAFKGGWAIMQGGAQPERAIATFTFIGKANAERALDVMRHYNLNQKCFIEPGFACYLSSGQPPSGAMAGEASEAFDPASLRVESRPRASKLDFGQAGGKVWAIMAGERQLFAFGDGADAQSRANQALGLIQHYGFTHLCHAGAFSYFRK
jgi:hypothetical protein